MHERYLDVLEDRVLVAAAVASALLTETFGFASGLVGYARRDLVDWDAAGAFLVISVPVALVGAVCAPLLAGDAGLLRAVYALLMISLATDLARRDRTTPASGDTLTDGAATATILKRGLACKRGRRTGAVNRKPVELILYKPGRLAWSRGGGSVTSVGVARCELRRPGSHTFVVETPFGHERSFRCERAADAEAWVTEVKAVLTTASSDFRPEDFAAAHVPRWRR